MAAMQDPLTDLLPPSRFDFDELSNFAFHPSPPPPPSIAWSPSAPRHGDKLRPRLLLLASSASGCHLLHHLPHKLLIASVLLPESQSHSSSLNPSPLDQVCYLYSLDEHSSVVLACIQYSVSPERSHAWVKVVFDVIEPENVLMMAAVEREHFRGKISADDQLVFRLETDKQRLKTKDAKCTIPYFPSGSLMDGIAAAVLSRCQIRELPGMLLLSWPDAGPSSISVLLSALSSALRNFPNVGTMEFSLTLEAPFKRKGVSDLDIYF